MLFTEQRFLVFFAVVFAVCWGLRRNGARKHWLLAASYFFYAAWDWRFLALIFASTAVDYVAGARIATAASPRTGRAWLVASLVTNLGILGFFKYFNFFVESAAGVLELLGWSSGIRTLPIILPVGISFFTFQSMSYTIDVHRGVLQPTRRFVDFALYVSFFPQLVAGPIVRARSFLPQLDSLRRFGDVSVRWCLTIFLVGFVKKACVADRLAVAVDAVFANDAAFGAFAHWLALALYSAQIYCDFSGYSDMAMGVAGLLGYRLTLNFDWPLLSKSIAEFWRRWHVSLSSWFRDYLFIPLGGNGNSEAMARRNRIIVFLLSGLWHGAGWTFVLWGFWHGAVQVLERTGIGRQRTRLPGFVQVAYMHLVLMLGWVLFRSEDMTQAGRYLGSLFGMGPGTDQLDPAWPLTLLGLAVVHAWNERVKLTDRFETLEPRTFAFAYGVLVALALPWVETGHRPFIYFQF